MIPHQNTPGGKLKEADGIGRLAIVFQLQQGFVKRHIFSCRHGRRIEESPGIHYKFVALDMLDAIVYG